MSILSLIPTILGGAIGFATGGPGGAMLGMSIGGTVGGALTGATGPELGPGAYQPTPSPGAAPVITGGPSAVRGLVATSMSSPAHASGAQMQPAAPAGYKGPGVQNYATGGGGTGGSGDLMSLINSNPGLVQLVMGAVGGAAKSYQEGKYLDLLQDRWDREREFPGSFYGRSR